MAKSELTVTINARLDVDHKTAETCLRLVEAFVNANPVDIVCHRKETGEMEFEYVFRGSGAWAVGKVRVYLICSM